MRLEFNSNSFPDKIMQGSMRTVIDGSTARPKTSKQILWLNVPNLNEN